MTTTGKVAMATPLPVPVASGAGILHGVALQLEPRALVRRKDSSDKARDVPALRAVTQPPRSAEDAYRDGLRQGHEKGYQEAIATVRQDAQRSGHEQGVQQGLIEGRAAGELDAMHQAQQARDAAMARFERVDKMLASFSAALADRLDSAEDDMVALCHEVVCRILGTAALDRASVAQMVRQAAGECLSADRQRAANTSLTVGIHRDDLEDLEADSSLAHWLEQQGARGVRWQADPNVELGGCVLHGSEGSVDARLETQLAALRAVLLSGRAKRNDTATSASDRTAEHRGLS